MGSSTTWCFINTPIYLCYKIYDSNTGDLYDTYESGAYTVKESLYRPDGTFIGEYTYSNDNNWIRITPTVQGEYTGVITFTKGSVTVTATRHITVSRNLSGKYWISETGYGDVESIGFTGTSYYFNYKLYDPDNGDLFNTYNILLDSYEPVLEIVAPDGSVTRNFFPNQDIGNLPFTPSVEGTYECRYYPFSYELDTPYIMSFVVYDKCSYYGHDYHYSAITAPTVTATGVLKGVCSRCTSTTTITLPKLSTADYYYSTITSPTCTSTGTGRYTWKIATYGTFYFDVTLPKTAHSYVDTVTPPTCTAQGYTTHTCSVCGDSYKDAYTNALGHNYSYSVTTAPTTSAAGILTGTCSRCGAQTSVALPKLTTTDYNYTVVTPATCTATGVGRYTWKTTTYGSFSFNVTIPKTAHSYVDTVTPPTCTAQGYTTHTCSVCGDSYRDSYTAALGHAWNGGVVSTPPTETQPGIMLYTCTRCGATKTESIPAIGHVHNYTATVVPPTCTNQGYTLHVCSCGDSYMDNYTDALGHDYGYAVTTTPTTSAGGTLTGTCSRCGGTTTVTLPKLNTTDYTYTEILPATQTATGIGRYTWKTSYYGTFSFDVVIPKLANPNPFVDISPTDPYYNDVLWAYYLQPYQITAGIDETHFGPDNTVTRAQAMTFFWIANGKPEPKTQVNPFKDVKKGKYYYKAVLWAVENGITAGTDETHFSPNKTCLRSEIIGFFYASVGKPGYTISNPYSDVSNSRWYKAASIWAYENGIERGSNGKFYPKTPCSRASTVLYLYRFLTGRELAE